MTLNSRAFRDALGHFATGVAVISARAGDAGTIGLTINSFASVSLDPPLVLWSLDRGSDRYPPLMQVSRFGIGVLGREGEDLSRRLARKGQFALGKDEVADGPNGVPLLRKAIAAFECEVEQRIDAGDHVIFLARVLSCSHAGHEAPLLYYRGAYRALAARGDAG
ncbi:MAG: flavin reductase family protein [Alphaproteobacteria bacterium]